MFKKITASIILACFIFINFGIYFTQTSLARGPIPEETESSNTSSWYFQEFPDWYSKVYSADNPEEIFGERYTAAQVEWVIYGIISYIINHIFGNVPLLGCLFRNVIENKIGDDLVTSCSTGIVGFICKLNKDGIIPIKPPDIICPVSDAELNIQYNTQAPMATNPILDIFSGARPISGIGYTKTILSRLNLIKDVKAQGFGFQAASAVRNIWVLVRNITYFFLIILIIAMSFMIMFRFKISPQTVITVQSAIPKIFISIILITFSYAIAGFLIDLLYVVIGIIAAVLSQSGLFTSPNDEWSEMYKDLAGIGIGQGLMGVFTFYNILFIITSIVVFFSTLTFLIPLGNIAFIIFIIVVLISLIFIFFKTMWMLIKTYITILLLIIAGPVFIITGGFVKWIKNMSSNLAVFATIGPMLAISFVFLASALPSGPLSDLFSNTIPFDPKANLLDNSPWLPPFVPFGKNLDLVWLIASVIVMTLIPKIADMIKSAVAGKPFGYGTAIGAAFGAAAGTLWSPFGQTISYAKEAYYKERAGRLTEAVRGAMTGIKLPRFGGK